MKENKLVKILRMELETGNQLMDPPAKNLRKISGRSTSCESVMARVGDKEDTSIENKSDKQRKGSGLTSKKKGP